MLIHTCGVDGLSGVCAACYHEEREIEQTIADVKESLK